MDWLRSLLTGAGAAFDQAGAGLVAIPLAFALGLLSAVVSACCTLPVLTVIVGYAGAQANRNLRQRCLSAGCFLIGAVLALVILGGVAAGIGQVAQGTLGRYWKLFAGAVAIVMGLGTLKLLPFHLPQGERLPGMAKHGGAIGAFLFGLVGGGAVIVCSLACNPGVFIILGAAVLRGVTLWMVGVLIAYSFGFALPLAALLLGASFGAAAVRLKGLESAVRILAGILLIAVGMYFLWTF